MGGKLGGLGGLHAIGGILGGNGGPWNDGSLGTMYWHYTINIWQQNNFHQEDSLQYLAILSVHIQQKVI